MNRTSYQFQPENITEFKTQLLFWAQQFKTAVWLDSNNYIQKHSSFDAILAVDAFSEIETDYNNAFQKLKEFQTNTNDYIFGYLSYDLKNDVEDLTSNNFDGLHFPDLYFFQPKKLFFIKGNTVEIKYLNEFSSEIESDLKNINAAKGQKLKAKSDLKIKLRIHKDEYYKKLYLLSKTVPAVCHVVKSSLYSQRIGVPGTIRAAIN